MTTLQIILLGGASALAIAAVVSPKFRQMFRIWGNTAVDSATTDIQKREDDYGQLKAKLPGQQSAVADVMARATAADRDWKAADEHAQSLEAKYHRLKDKATEQQKKDLALAWTEAVAAANEKRTFAEELAKDSEEAVADLEATLKDMKKFASSIEKDKANNALADAKNIATAARRQAASMRDSISASSQASANIQHKLDKARAEAELSKGSKTDRDLAKLEQDAAADAAIAALEGKGKPAGDTK